MATISLFGVLAVSCFQLEWLIYGGSEVFCNSQYIQTSIFNYIKDYRIVTASNAII